MASEMKTVGSKKQTNLCGNSFRNVNHGKMTKRPSCLEQSKHDPHVEESRDTLKV